VTSKEEDMATRGIRRRAGLLVGTGAAAIVFLAVAVAPAGALTYRTVYNNIPNPFPGNLPSLGYEATSTSEFGGQVDLAGSARKSPKVVVTMSSWACQRGHWFSGDCKSNSLATFSHPLTANIYAVNNDDSPGALLGSVTHEFNLPYRPSANDTKCTGSDAGKWWHRRSDTCFNGKATRITFTMGPMTIPDKAIVSVAYNTTHYGDSPIGEGAACFSGPGGCPYDALNVGVAAPPSVGSLPLPADAYLDSTWSGAYCDNGAGGTGVFRLDEGCWTGFQPAIKVAAHL
jgi:hypothetical protein